MLLEIPKNFTDFELLDTGQGRRLEKWGEVILSRPDPQIIWGKSLPQNEWEKSHAVFISGKNGESGKWDIRKKIPNPWIIKFGDIIFSLKLSPFKHTGLFAEQAAQWEWMLSKIKDKGSKILNLFAYTGGATMVLAKAGCQVTHVDASKPAITWANENYRLNFAPVGAAIGRPNNGKPLASPTQDKHSPGNVRWILDDAVKFVKRELKRGAKYDAIIMDPPAFGHGPTGKVWKFNENLPELLEDCVNLLSDNAKFLVINGYATNSSAISLNNLLENKIKNRSGKIEFGELCLKQKKIPVKPDRFRGADRIISTGIFSRWSDVN